MFKYIQILQYSEVLATTAVINILALDQASRTSGYAIFQHSQLVASGTFTYDDGILNSYSGIVVKKIIICLSGFKKLYVETGP